MVALGRTGLDVLPLCLGGNVFGWTADARQSEAVLDAFVAGGGTFVDMADVYSSWVPGNSGGESETIVGDWMAARGNREQIVVATKVGNNGGLSADNIRRCAEASLRRLKTDHIDLYYAHRDDPETPQEDTLAAFDALVREGKVRHIGASNFSAERLASALAICDRDGRARYTERDAQAEPQRNHSPDGRIASARRSRTAGSLQGKPSHGVPFSRHGAGTDSPVEPSRESRVSVSSARAQTASAMPPTGLPKRTWSPASR